MLEAYANGANAANFLEFDSIPQLLFGVVGTHFESDPGAVAISIKAILYYSSGNIRSSNRSKSEIESRTRVHRCAILRELFQKALRSGGIEHALQAIQRLGIAYWNTATTASGAESSAAATRRVQKDTILGCWKIVMLGIRAGLSRYLYMLVVQACLADLVEMKGILGSSTSPPSSSLALNFHSEVLRAVLKTMREAIARPELTVHDLARERNEILTNCLALLSKACLCGVSPNKNAGNQTGDDATSIRNDDDDDDMKGDDRTAIPLIEDGLAILAVCAQKRLLLRSDFERLVPACNACLRRYVFSSKNGNADQKEDMAKSIPIRVVQLLEAEDATIGLWLRETYGIPAPALIENPNRLQESLHSMQQMGGRDSHRNTSSGSGSGSGDIRGDGDIWEQMSGSDNVISAATNPRNGQHRYYYPPPLQRYPPVSAPLPQMHRSFVICDPEDTSSEEEDYYDHEEDEDEDF